MIWQSAEIFMRAFLLALLLCLAWGTNPLCAQAQGDSSGMSQQMQFAKDEADAQQYRQMERVASYLDQYCAQNHRWPDQGEEQQFIQQQLNQLVPINPYTQAGAPWLPTQGSEGPQDVSGNLPLDQYYDNVPQGTRVKLVFDPSLNTTMAKEYINDPPEDWQRRPGAITAVSNNQDLFVVWGAGINGKPLRNMAGQMRLIFGRFGMLYYGE